MKKIILFIFMVSLSQAQDYNSLLEKAIVSSPYIKANNLMIQGAKEQANIISRYKNPTLSIEGSQFNQKIGDSEIGYRVSVTQPIRLWGVSGDRSNLANKIKSEIQGLVVLKRAEFIKIFSMLYNNYITNVSLSNLAKKEFIISKQILNITKTRYDLGTISKVKFIRAKIDLINSKNEVNEKKITTISSYYKLLSFSGIKEELKIDKDYTFSISDKLLNKEQGDSAEIQYLQAKQNKEQAKARLNDNKIEWINVYTEYENEVEQDIVRFGVDIPLAVFNTKSEERQIALLKSKQNNYLIENKKNSLFYTLKRLQKQLVILNTTISSTEELYISQKDLLKMYEDGYKVANINLIELQNVKNQMIKTKEKEISLKNLKNKNIILYNYEIGEYNE